MKNIDLPQIMNGCTKLKLKLLIHTRIASFRTRIVGTRLGTLESIFRRSRACRVFWSLELLVNEGFTLTFNLCSAQRSDFLNCPDIVLTLPMSNSYQGPAAHLRSFVPSASRIVPGSIFSGQKTEMKDFTYSEELGQWAVDLS